MAKPRFTRMEIEISTREGLQRSSLTIHTPPTSSIKNVDSPFVEDKGKRVATPSLLSTPFNVMTDREFI